MINEKAIQKLQESLLPGISRRYEQLWKIIEICHSLRETDKIRLKNAASYLDEAMLQIKVVLVTNNDIIYNLDHNKQQ